MNWVQLPSKYIRSELIKNILDQDRPFIKRNDSDIEVFILTDEIHNWIKINIRMPKNKLKYFFYFQQPIGLNDSESGWKIIFPNGNAAMLFKLTWI